MRNVSILGSTGSIGTQTLDVIRLHRDEINVVGLSAGRNIKLLEEQAREFKPEIISVERKEDASLIKAALSDLDIKITYGMEGLIEVASYEKTSLVVSAVVGMMGILPVYYAINHGKNIAFANKETLVTAGHIIMPLVKEKHVDFLPVDSEHSAIFQSLQGNENNKISKIILTCSGGPFRDKDIDFLKNVKKEDALKHPNWTMGQKITIDSASLVNKGLEVIEAKWLFNVNADDIEVYIHPQSVIHSGVEYEDGAIMCQMGTPDMHLPISYALFYPERKPSPLKKLNLFDIGNLSFSKPNANLRGIEFALKALDKSGNMPTIFNAANEEAVALFLQDKIRFLDIYDIIDKAMCNISYINNPSIEEVLLTEEETRHYIRNGWRS